MFHEIFTIPYAIIGGQATKFYMPERHTLDWDILVATEDLEQARKEAAPAGATSVRPRSIPGFSCVLCEGVRLDVIAEASDWVAAALEQARTSQTNDPVLSLEWLVLLKLTSARVQDLADISRMMGLLPTQPWRKRSIPLETGPPMPWKTFVP